MTQTAETRRHRSVPQREDAVFNWEDPLDLESELTEEERMVRDTARGYAQDKLFPRVLRDNREERFDRAIPQAIADPLSRDARLDGELGPRAGESEGAVAKGVGGQREPGRLGIDTHAGGSRNRLPHIRFKPRQQHIQRAPAVAFPREMRFAVRHRGGGTIREQRNNAEDDDCDQHFDQRERPLPVRRERHGRGLPR